MLGWFDIFKHTQDLALCVDYKGSAKYTLVLTAIIFLGSPYSIKLADLVSLIRQ